MERINIGVVGDFPSGIVISIIQAYNLGDIKAAQQSVQADGGGLCACEELSEHSVVAGVCVYCNRPRQ